ncbi:MAG: hypothetical protein NVS4B12_02620 [Ktedonobacteraceae bacterium]
MHDTLLTLVERALTGNSRPLEFYLRDHSRLPGPRANLELANDVGEILASSVPKYSENVRTLITQFANGDRKKVASNTPEEFVMLCGIIAFGTCAAVYAPWREESFEMLEHYACSTQWRVREGVAIAFQHLLTTVPHETLQRLVKLAAYGNYLQQRAAVAAIAEPPLLYNKDLLETALKLQRIVLERLRNAPKLDRKTEELRTLRRTLGYTVSVVTVVLPEQGFALMRECASWNDADITWILRENLKKKRLAKFPEDTDVLAKMLA